MKARGVQEDPFWACYNLVSAGDLLVTVYQEALRPHGLTRDEWRILAILDLVGESEPRRLAETLWLARSTIVNAVGRLERAGFVHREAATNDRRLVIVSLTESGRTKLEEATVAYVGAINDLNWNFSAEEMDQLYELSSRFWRDNYARVPKSLTASPRVSPAESDAS